MRGRPASHNVRLVGSGCLTVRKSGGCTASEPGPPQLRAGAAAAALMSVRRQGPSPPAPSSAARGRPLQFASGQRRGCHACVHTVTDGSSSDLGDCRGVAGRRHRASSMGDPDLSPNAQARNTLADEHHGSWRRPSKAQPRSKEAAIISLGEVLDLPSLKIGRPEIVAGAAQIGRPVRWAHIGEFADVDTVLRQNEVVLTTGVALPQSASALRAYVRRLAAVPITALIVELGRRFATLPRELVQEAHASDVTLVALHSEVQFAQVTEAVHSRIVDDQYERLESRRRLQQTFAELSPEGSTPAEVVRLASSLTGRTVVFENVSGQAVFSDDPQAPAGLIAEWQTSSRLMSSRAGELADRWITTPVAARGHTWGRLVMLTDGPPKPAELVVLEKAAATLALHRLIRDQRAALVEQSRGSFLDSLASGLQVSPDEIEKRCHQLKFSTKNRAFVAVVVGARKGASPPPAWQERLRVAIAAAPVADSDVQTLTSSAESDGLGILVSFPESVNVDASLHELGKAIRALATSGDADTFSVGVSETTRSLANIHTSFTEARRAAELGARTAGEGEFVRLSDLRLDGLLAAFQDDPRLRTYIEEQLGSLLVEDDRAASDLTSTLETFLASGGNKSRAADLLGKSRPALDQRLRKIEEILAVDLSDATMALSLYVALRAANLMGESTRDDPSS